ncbi:response regulator transcription factor [Campylobacter hominis]|uniref:response regulator transcription factor n=1 Tax=Campylobacter hominis TaxID=76517 RepID=UPI0023F4B512|nr:response regulator transcription factor [Campylobacter hominis]MDD7422496.1 response regulator transcription factor [Campylobacter hominis]MDY3117148.1 response regulator transcription factor [Campylobacter hominis]
MQNLIAIIDDELDLLELLEYNLKKAGFDAIGFLNTNKIEQFLNEEDVDLLIVDRNLPGIEGSKFVENLRAKGYNTPVIFLTAKTSKEEQMQGFGVGGDDYITKPFDLDNLIARIKAVLKRTQKSAEIYKFKDILINSTSAKTFINDKEIELTKLETSLLTEFIKNKSIVLNREYLAESVWHDTDTSKQTINIAIKRLRDKIDPKKEKNYIKVIRGEGYELC